MSPLDSLLRILIVLFLDILPFAWLLTRLFRSLFNSILFPIVAVGLALKVGALDRVWNGLWVLPVLPGFASFASVLASFR